MDIVAVLTKAEAAEGNREPGGSSTETRIRDEGSGRGADSLGPSNERRLAMEKRDSNLNSLHDELAGRFGALSQLFGKLSSSKASQELLDSLTSGDAAAFNQLIDIVDMPILGKCFWVREIIERVVVTPAGFVEECWLRDSLTPSERGLYLQIAFRHRQEKPVAQSMEVTIQTGHAVIPPGPFLDELKANGLVTCDLRMTYDTSAIAVMSKPERVCV